MFRDLYVLAKKIFAAFVKIFISKKDAGYIKQEYRLIIIKDHDLKEVFNVLLSREKVYLLLSSISVISFCLAFVLFAYTPLQYLLPGYGLYQEKKELLLLKNEVDSLEQQFSYNEKFIKQFQSYFTSATQDMAEADKNYIPAAKEPVGRVRRKK